MFLELFRQNDKICNVRFIKSNSHFVSNATEKTPTRYLIKQ